MQLQPFCERESLKDNKDTPICSRKSVRLYMPELSPLTFVLRIRGLQANLDIDAKRLKDAISHLCQDTSFHLKKLVCHNPTNKHQSE